MRFLHGASPPIIHGDLKVITLVVFCTLSCYWIDSNLLFNASHLNQIAEKDARSQQT